MSLDGEQGRTYPFVLAALFLFACAAAPDSVRAQSVSQDDAAPPASANSPATDDKKPGANSESPSGTVKLHIKVTASKTDKPIGNASVYVRFPVSGGLLHRDKLAEMDLKTNQDGSVRVPEIPQGRVMVQVVAPGWHTFGKWYDVTQSEQTINIQLDPPPHWY
jgi:hypothetical protein